MDHFRILRRAWDITWNYRALWVFGVLLALTTGSGGQGGGSSNARLSMPAPPGGFIPPEAWPAFPWAIGNALITLSIALICFIFLLVIAFAILRYVAEVALIRMVDVQEDSGEKLSWRAGFRLGWNRSAFRIFLIDLLIFVGVLIPFLILLLIALSPLLLWLVESEPLRVVGVLATVGFVLLLILVVILVAIALGLLTPFFHRSAALEGLGVIDSIRNGFGFVRRRFSDVLIMGILLFGIGLAVAIITIPLVLVLLLAAGVLGGLPGLGIYWVLSQFTQGAVPVIIAVLIGLPIFLVVVIVPILLFSGLFEVYKSSTWTLVYREIRAFGNLLSTRLALDPDSSTDPGFSEE